MLKSRYCTPVIEFQENSDSLVKTLNLYKDNYINLILAYFFLFRLAPRRPVDAGVKRPAPSLVNQKLPSHSHTPRFREHFTLQPTLAFLPTRYLLSRISLSFFRVSSASFLYFILTKLRRTLHRRIFTFLLFPESATSRPPNRRHASQEGRSA